MSEQETLELVSTTTYDGSGLERFEDALDSVDNKIKSTGGGGDDEVNVDINATLHGDVGEILALERAIDNLDDKTVTIDVETNDARVGNVDRGQGLATSGGRRSFDSTLGEDSDILNRLNPALMGMRARNQRFADISDALGNDIRRERFATSANPPTHFAAPFGEGEGAVEDDEDIANLMNTLGFEGNQRFAGDVDRSDVNFSPASGMAAEGVGGVEMRDIITSRRRAFREQDTSKSLRQQARELSSQIARMRFTIGTFHQLFASLIPLIGIFIGALPAAITALGGLAAAGIAAAGALGAIGVLGIGGMMLTESGQLDVAPLRQRFRELAQSFIEAFTPLMRTFAPTVETALQSVESMAAPLAAASQGLLQFRSTFIGLAETISTALPSFVSQAIAFGAAVRPIFAAIGSFFGNTNFLGAFAKELSTALPALMIIGSALTDIVPAIIHVSQGFLTFAAVLTGLVGIVSSVLTQFPRLATAIGIVASGLLTLLTITSLYSIATSGALGAAVSLAGGLLYDAAAALIAAVGLEATTLSVIALYSAITLGIAGLIAFGSQFEILGGQIKQAREQLDAFNSIAGGEAEFGTSQPTAVGGGNGRSPYVDHTTVIDASSRDDAARQQYSESFERRQHVDSVFGG